MIIMPLGISSATPTANRHLASVALWRDGRIFLFDCGENAQMRMLQAGMKRSKVDYVFITHLHGDHYFGLLGLIATLHIQRRDRPLYIVAPSGIKEFVEFNLKIAGIEPAFEIHITELADTVEHQIVVDESDFYVEARSLKHSKSCFGFRYQERDKPGKVNAELATELGITEDEQFKQLKSGVAITLADGTVVEPDSIVGEARKGDSFAYVTDTDFCENAVLLGKDVTILYHEATFGKALEDKALETGHSTAEMAADVAIKANAQRLVIGHFSARYSNQYVLLKEARRIFPDTWLATELRPIMTDPVHEKAIFKTMSESTSDSLQHRSNRGRGDLNDRPRKKRMMTRRSSPVEGSYRREQRGTEGQGGDYYRSRGSSRPPYQRDGGYNRNADRPFNRDQGGYSRGGDRPYNREQGGYSRGGDRPYQRDQGSRYPQRDPGYTRGADRPYNREFNRDGGYDRPYNRDASPQDRPVNRDYTRSDRPYQRDQDQSFDRRRSGTDDEQIKRDDHQRASSPDRRPITPRNTFDDYDRF